MGKIYFASIRLAFALLCVGGSLILGGHWLGLIPDGELAAMRGRQTLCETIAINSAAHVRKSQWLDLKTSLQTLADRNDDLMSIGVRSDSGALRVDTGHHRKLWDSIQQETANIDLVTVPITLNRREWGQVELCFTKPDDSKMATLMRHPLLRLLTFFFGAGIFAYTIFVGRLLRLFNETQVVPDRVRQALDTLAEGLLVLDERERIVLANRAFAETVGVTTSELMHQRASDLPWSERNSMDAASPWGLAINQGEVQTERMLRYQLKDGSERIFSVNAAPLGNDSAQKGALATFRDVTHIEEHRAELEKMLSMLRGSRDEIERKNAELQILATQDALSGCLNRRAFFERFDVLFKEAQETGNQLSCIMIDNDHFKSVNDTYGHHVGDEVLRRVAKTIRERHGEKGLVCRYGGEEFCVVLANTTLEDAVAEAELTRIAISEITFENPSELTLTASLGVSETRFNPNEPQDIINQADVCLYAAKRGGRNVVVPYQHGMSADDIAEGASEEQQVTIPYPAVTALVSALSYRDLETAEHSRRVSELCARVAEDILPQQEAFVLEIAGLLHDIGKVGVPDDILRKPGPLTDEEWKVMSQHDHIGIEIVAGAFDCPSLTEIIQSHYSFCRGKAGESPTGCIGSEVPMAARILTICDSYDAMVSDRVYRKGRSHDEAIQELRRCAETQFDPDLVERFASVISEQKRLKEEARHPSPAAIQIGYQVEQIASAIEDQDADSMRKLTQRLRMYAVNCEVPEIARAAENIEKQVAGEDIQWFDVLRQANELLNICRSQQASVLAESSTEANGANAPL